MEDMLFAAAVLVTALLVLRLIAHVKLRKMTRHMTALQRMNQILDERIANVSEQSAASPPGVNKILEQWLAARTGNPPRPTFVTVNCPECGKEWKDSYGLGRVILCPKSDGGCGYCKHAILTVEGKRCEFCGELAEAARIASM